LMLVLLSVQSGVRALEARIIAEARRLCEVASFSFFFSVFATVWMSQIRDTNNSPTLGGKDKTIARNCYTRDGVRWLVCRNGADRFTDWILRPDDRA